MGEITHNPLQYIITESGTKISVVLPIEEYEKMAEDIHDLAVLAEQKEENSISLSDMKHLLNHS
jgi:hypothetical protein